MANETMLIKSSLRARGWTDTLIRTFLLKPDQIRDNPVYAHQAPMKLYKLSRVIRIEKTKRFIEMKKSADQRKLAAQKALKTKRAKMQEYIDSIVVEVPHYEESVLIARACDNYNSRNWDSDNAYASPNSDRLFLARITVNYLRHSCTRYETHLAEIAGKIDARSAYLQIKEQILEAIGEQYDWLSENAPTRSSERMISFAPSNKLLLNPSVAPNGKKRS